MKLHSICIEGFRRHTKTEILFSDTTFLIGSNNVGKSSILKALDYLLTDKKKISEHDYFCILNENKENQRLTEEVVITAEFRNVPIEALEWKGFNRQRLFEYDVPEDSNETGLKIYYRKTYKLDSQAPIIEMQQYKLELKAQFLTCSKVQDYIDAGLSEEDAEKFFIGKTKTQKIPGNLLKDLEDIAPEELFDVNKSETIWFENPGGISGNVLTKLPKFLLIPDQAKTEELSGNKGALITTLNSLFEDVRNSSSNFEKAQFYLEELAKELDPKDEESEFAQMLSGLNKVVGDVFPETTFLAQANLSNPGSNMKKYVEINLKDFNITLPLMQEGTSAINEKLTDLKRNATMY